MGQLQQKRTFTELAQWLRGFLLRLRVPQRAGEARPPPRLPKQDPGHRGGAEARDGTPRCQGSLVRLVARSSACRGRTGGHSLCSRLEDTTGHPPDVEDHGGAGQVRGAHQVLAALTPRLAIRVLGRRTVPRAHAPELPELRTRVRSHVGHQACGHCKACRAVHARWHLRGHRCGGPARLHPPPAGRRGGAAGLAAGRGELRALSALGAQVRLARQQRRHGRGEEPSVLAGDSSRNLPRQSMVWRRPCPVHGTAVG
mmetsp:Transcript_94072/g.304315  ORF Transcript_94072/g.304315 Transcript_94072/m.304315 type:complete len:256 (+) Transcript_94072:1180-1947(+)